MSLHYVQRRPILLLEVIIAFALVALCALPLIYPHVFILRSEKTFVSTVELDHFVNLLFVDRLQKLFQNEIPWEDIERGKPIHIDDTLQKSLGNEELLPFIGTYRFIPKSKKASKEGDHAAYIYFLEFTFEPKKSAFVGNTQEKYTYTYEIAIERKSKQ